MDQRSLIPLMDRIRYVGYGVIGGMVAGAFFGWMFHSWVGFIVKLVIVIILLVPLIGAIFFWRKVTTNSPSPPATNVRDADWIELEARSNNRR